MSSGVVSVPSCAFPPHRLALCRRFVSCARNAAPAIEFPAGTRRPVRYVALRTDLGAWSTQPAYRTICKLRVAWGCPCSIEVLRHCTPASYRPRERFSAARPSHRRAIRTHLAFPQPPFAVAAPRYVRLRGEADVHGRAASPTAAGQ